MGRKNRNAVPRSAIKRDGICAIALQLAQDDPVTWGHLLRRRQSVIDRIEPTGYTSPRREEAPRNVKQHTQQAGTVRYFRNNYGFIGENLFFHIDDVIVGRDKIRRGSKVTYELRETEKGPRAVNVRAKKDGPDESTGMAVKGRR